MPMRAQVICIVGSRTLRGATWNLSERGIQLELPELPKRATVQLSFRLPRSESIIDMNGTVVWVMGRRHGIKVNDMRHQSHELIRTFIEQHKDRDQLS